MFMAIAMGIGHQSCQNTSGWLVGRKLCKGILVKSDSIE